MGTNLAAILASIVVTLISAGFAYASQRASSKATAASSKLDLERDAYERARKFDIATIERQDRELAELRADNKRLINKVNVLLYKVIRLERGLPPDAEVEELLDAAEPEPGAELDDSNPKRPVV